MTLELTNSVAAIGTFCVIGATAIAAVVQLRHLRASNQLQGLLTVLARVEDARFNEWTDGAQRMIAERVPDPNYRRSIVDGTVERENNQWLNLGNSYEWVGSLIRQGLIDENAFMDVYSARVLAAWWLLEEVTALRRRGGDPTLWENFEYLFVRAQLWEQRHASGTYPKNMPRAQIRDKWLAADSGTA
jgi:uncharacterized protein DUF4760